MIVLLLKKLYFGAVWHYIRPLIIVGSLLLATSLSAQFNLALGVGMGFSRHADTYQKEDFFKIFDYPGYRLIVLEARPYYNITDRTAIFTIVRYSPSSIASPYKYLSGYMGVEQTLPDSGIFFTAGYGPNSSFDDEKLSDGPLFMLGLGRKNELFRWHLSTSFGGQDNLFDFPTGGEWRTSLILSINLMNHGI